MVIRGFILLGNKALLEAGKPIEESDNKVDSPDIIINT